MLFISSNGATRWLAEELIGLPLLIPGTTWPQASFTQGICNLSINHSREKFQISLITLLPITLLTPSSSCLTILAGTGLGLLSIWPFIFTIFTSPPFHLCLLFFLCSTFLFFCLLLSKLAFSSGIFFIFKSLSQTPKILSFSFREVFVEAGGAVLNIETRTSFVQARSHFLMQDPRFHGNRKGSHTCIFGKRNVLLGLSILNETDALAPISGLQKWV